MTDFSGFEDEEAGPADPTEEPQPPIEEPEEDDGEGSGTF